MQYSSYVENLILKEHQSGLLEVSKIWSEYCSDIPATAYYKMIERLEEKGSIMKLAKGVYCVPRITKFGKLPLSENEILEHYIGKNKRYGVEISYGLYSRLGLTTQVPKKRVVYTTKLESKTKSYKNIDLIKIYLPLNEVQKELICGLEVMQNIETIQEINYACLYKYLSNLAVIYNEKEFMKVLKEIKYKKKTLAFYHSVLTWFGVDNNIAKMLSPTSNYKIYKMEDIYEFAQ